MLPDRLFVVISRQVGPSALAGILRQRKFSLLQWLPRAAHLLMHLKNNSYEKEKGGKKSPVVPFSNTNFSGTSQSTSSAALA